MRIALFVDRSWKLAVLACLLSLPVTRAVHGQATDFDGAIATNQWLALGPFVTPIACDGIPGPTGLFGNHIGPQAHIACEAPEEGQVVEGYDPTDPTVVSSGLAVFDDLVLGISNSDGAGNPVWWPFDDGSPTDGTNNLDGTPLGDISQHMMWLATYVEYLGDDPVLVEFCVGSDDDVQVWVDDQLVHNNPACRAQTRACQDRPAAIITPGVHVIKIGVWEEGGGWACSLAILEEGQPVLDGLSPDWAFLGREGDVDLSGCDPEAFLEFIPPPQGLSCTRNDDGSVSLSWGLPIEHDQGVEIPVLVDGVEVASLPGSSTSYTVSPAAAAGARLFCVGTSGGLNACTGCTRTDAQGLITTSSWLAVGPFAQPFGCGTGAGNHIAPSFIGCEYPAAGEELREGYDPAVATTTGLNIGAPASGAGAPIWYPFDDGSDDGELNMDLSPAGGQSFHMMWVSTWVEYTGDLDPLDLNLCVSSDDGVQVWINDQQVHDNSVCRAVGPCQDVVPVSLPGPGLYCIRAGVWENEGGWAFRLGMQDLGGIPILDGDPDWVFYGRDRPGDWQDRVPGGPESTECPSCTLPVENVTCEFGQVGIGQGLVVTWTNPDDCPCITDTEVFVSGVSLGTFPTDSGIARISAALLPAGTFDVTVVNCSGVGVSCSPFCTDDQGAILTNCWLALGPIANGFGCNNNNDDILGNHIAPSFIGCEYPEEGDEPVDGVDFTDPDNVAFGFHPSAPTTWHRFRDNTPTDGDLDFDQDIAGNVDDHMMWLVTYAEYTGDGGTFQACIGSDDGVQVWMNDQLLHNNNACRARGFCQDTAFFTLDGPTVIRFALGVWERAGGWGGSLAINDDLGAPIVDGGGGAAEEWIFHGTDRPDGFDGPCTKPLPAVEQLTCVKNPDGGVDVSWVNVEPDPDQDIVISVDGVDVAAIGGDEESFIVDAAQITGESVGICVDNGSFAPRCCGVLLGEELYINCGGPPVFDVQGRDWTEDTLGNPSPFLTGPNQNVATFGAPLDLISDPWLVKNEYPTEIFSTERWNNGPVEYTVSGMDPGLYEVTLLFMEGCCSDGCLSDGSDVCDAVSDDASPPFIDPADPVISAGGCRVFDIFINDEIVRDQFSQNALAACLSGNPPGATSNLIGMSVVATVDVVDALKIALVDLGGTNPPENAAIKGIAVVPSGPRENCTNGTDDDGDGDIDCADSQCANAPNCLGIRMLRGDSNNDGRVNIADAQYTLNGLFLGGPPHPCQAQADSNGDGRVNIADAQYTLNALFLGGPAPPAPHPTCGSSQDPGDLALGCETPNC